MLDKIAYMHCRHKVDHLTKLLKDESNPKSIHKTRVNPANTESFLKLAGSVQTLDALMKSLRQKILSP